MRTIIGALMAAALTAAACDPTVEGRVCGFGDSLAAQNGEELSFALAVGKFVPDGEAYDSEDGEPDFVPRPRSDVYVPVAAIPGARLDLSILSGTHRGRLDTSGVPCSQVFASWGTNDSLPPIPGLSDAFTVREKIDRFMGDMGGRTVLWLVPHAVGGHAVDFYGVRPEEVAKWQEELELAALRWPNLHLQAGRDEWLGDDDVHYTPEGQVALANEVADRLLALP